jgi:hypothetical protein
VQDPDNSERFVIQKDTNVWTVVSSETVTEAHIESNQSILDLTISVTRTPYMWQYSSGVPAACLFQCHDQVDSSSTNI